MKLKRTSTVGLSLLAALVFSAFMAQSAFAAFEPAETTAFECAPEGGELDYSDAHCDNAVTPGTGSFGHVAIAEGVETKIEATNEQTKNSTTESTPAILKGELGGVRLELTAQKVHVTGHIKNTGGHVEGLAETEYSQITVQKPANCEKNNPITFNADFEGVKQGAEMGVLFKPEKPPVFVIIELEGAKCAIAGIPLEVEGTAIATAGPGPVGNPTANGSGATSVFEPGNGMENLEIGEAPAEFTSITTTKMKEGNPIALTTGH